MNLKCKINGIEYNNLVQGFNISEEYNETLDSASIILSNIEKMDLRPYDDVYIYEGEFKGYGDGVELPSFFLHFLVDQFTEEMINPSENADEIRYKYKIDLFSETKKLETIQLPNFSITQPLDINKKKSVYDYMLDVVDLYNPLLKVGENGIWHYEKKYKVDTNLKQIFGSVYSPDFSLNNPNLRDVLTQLMLTKDMIPVVHNDIITALDISKRNGAFNVDKRYITSIVGSRSSDNHCDGLKRTYNNALSQDNTCKMVEYLGFRNSESGMLTLENMRLETRYPIYKINKVYMCYYKKIKLLDEQGNVQDTRTFLCKQDISKLIKLNAERNLLSEDWVEFNKNAHTGMTIDELAKYKLCTIGYDIGSKHISGWGNKYSYISNPIFNNEVVRTYIENILRIVDVKTPYGIYNYGYITANSVPPIPNGYAFTGTTGTIEDRVVNIYSNFSLFLKSLFFEVEYNAFYNGTIVHSKDVDRDDIIMNDNSSSSLTLLEQDGVFSKEKVNRFGNKVIQINATYDSFDQLQELGSVYNYGGDEDVIIYHREISVNDNVINCVYYGSKDYVLKNYFTSVNARHRPFNLLSYDESVRRSENRKMYILMSKDKYYVEQENRVINIDISFIDKFLSFYKETTLGASKGDFRFSSKINYGYYSYGTNLYASDLNAFASGNSLCFNISMYDNVSGGVYIDPDPEKLEPNMKDIDDDYIKGSIQKWHFSSDEKTGFAEYMGFYATNSNQGYVYDKFVTNYSDTQIKKKIRNNLLMLPKVNYADLENSVSIGQSFKINKDNKELIDMTYQIELISDSDDILFSSWGLKLSELLGNYLKFGEDKTASDFQNEESSYKVIYTTLLYRAKVNYDDVSELARMTRKPLMMLEIRNDNLSSIKVGSFKANFIFANDESSEAPSDISNKEIIYYSFEAKEIIESNSNTIVLKGKQKIIEDGGFLGFENSEYNDEATLTLKKVNKIGNTDTPSGYTWFSNCEVTINEEYGYNVSFFEKNNLILYDGENKNLDFNKNLQKFYATTSKKLEKNEAFDESNYEYVDEYVVKDGSIEETIYKKNIFITRSISKMKKEVIYNELKELTNVSSVSPNDVFFITDNPNGNGGKCLAINSKKIGKLMLINGTPYPIKSIQVWYKDDFTYQNKTDGLISSGEKGYHFVFGVNVDFSTNEYIYINLSLLSLKDKRVYDNARNLIGEVKNEANTTEPVSTQNYNVK